MEYRKTRDAKIPLIAELAGAETCSALGLTVTSSTPVLELCRRLIKAGHDPAAPLEAYRGIILCLRVRSIVEGAVLEINTKGTGFIRHRAVRAASPMRQNDRSGR